MLNSLSIMLIYRTSENWSIIGRILEHCSVTPAKKLVPGLILAAKSGPPLPKLVPQGGPNLANI